MKDLTRQYRPNDWNSIVGQEHLVKILQSEIKNNSVGQVYLFCGPRGTGKTTTARVFAKNLDAQVIELDAASNNGVDHIRNLKDDVLFLPSEGKKYKVYIIDEVHMLTTGAFNAFLKTLEEPPAHVVFVLATTDPQKIPITVLSRCQRFDLRRITEKDIINRLAFIANEENIQVGYPDDAEGDGETPYDVYEYIARSVDGGMRDAIKLLQKCTSLDEIITVQTVVDALGSVNILHIDEMINRLLSKDIKGVLVYFNNLVKEGIDVKILLANIVEKLTEDMRGQVVNNDFEIVGKMNLADSLLELLSSLRNSTQVKTITELRLISLCISDKETKTSPQQETVSNVTTQVNQPSLDIDDAVLQRVMDSLTNLEKRMMANEMQIDTLKFRR